MSRLGLVGGPEQPRESVAGVEVRRFDQFKTLLEEINDKLDGVKHTPKSYFMRSERDVSMYINEFRYRIEDLKVKKKKNFKDKKIFFFSMVNKVIRIMKKTKSKFNNYPFSTCQINLTTWGNTVEQLIREVRSQGQEEMVDVQEFCKVLEVYQKTQDSKRLIEVENAKVNWFMNIVDGLQNEKKSFDGVFKTKEDQFRPGHIKEYDFEKALINELRLKKDYYYDIFYHAIKFENELDLSLDKIRDGYNMEIKARKVIDDLKLSLKGQSSDHLFDDWDRDNDKHFNEKEFKPLIRLIDSNLNNDEIRYLVRRLFSNYNL